MEDLAREDRERLERYLEWERSTRRVARRRQRRYVSGAALAGVVVVVLVAWLMNRAGTQDRVASVPQRASADQVGSASGLPRAEVAESRPPAAATESAPAAAVTESAPPPAVPERAFPAPVEPATKSSETQRRDTNVRGPASGSERPRVAPRPTSRVRTAPEPLPSRQSPPRSAADSTDVVAAPVAPATPPPASITTPTEPPAPAVSAPADVMPPRREVPATPSEPPTAVAPPAAPQVPPATVAVPPATPPPAASPTAPAAQRDPVMTPREDRVETLKRWVGYIPEVRLGKAIVRWVKSQPRTEPRASSDSVPAQAR